MASDPSRSRDVGNRTSNVSSDVNMGCLAPTGRSKSSDDCAGKRVCSAEGWMFRVDAHHHLWDLSVRDQPWITEQLAPIRRTFTVDDLAAAAAGVDATVVVQTVSDAGETPELLSIADPLIAGVVGWGELSAPDAG